MYHVYAHTHSHIHIIITVIIIRHIYRYNTIFIVCVGSVCSPNVDAIYLYASAVGLSIQSTDEKRHHLTNIAYYFSDLHDSNDNNNTHTHLYS